MRQIYTGDRLIDVYGWMDLQGRYISNEIVSIYVKKAKVQFEDGLYRVLLEGILKSWKG